MKNVNYRYCSITGHRSNGNRFRIMDGYTTVQQRLIRNAWK